MHVQTLFLLFLPAALAMFVSVPPAAADLDCLSGSTGGTITWNSAWQSDGEDRGALYTVTNVVHLRRPESHSIQLELLAQTNAKVQRRVLVVKAAALAAQVCQTLGAASGLRPGNQGITVAPLADPVETEQRFIRYTASGWVRDDPPPRRPLTTCRVMDQNFKCLPEEKERYGASLKELEQEIRMTSPR